MDSVINEGAAAAGQQVKLKDLSVDQVCQWLRSIGRDENVVDDFRKQKICGLALSRLDERHFDKMPSVMIGDQLIIIEKRNERLAKEEAETASLKDLQNIDSSIVAYGYRNLNECKSFAGCTNEIKVEELKSNVNNSDEAKFEICGDKPKEDSAKNVADTLLPTLYQNTAENVSVLFHSEHESKLVFKNVCSGNDNLEALSFQQTEMVEQSQEQLDTDSNLMVYRTEEVTYSSSKRLSDEVTDVITVENRQLEVEFSSSHNDILSKNDEVVLSSNSRDEETSETSEQISSPKSETGRAVSFDTSSVAEGVLNEELFCGSTDMKYEEHAVKKLSLERNKEENESKLNVNDFKNSNSSINNEKVSVLDEMKLVNEEGPGEVSEADQRESSSPRRFKNKEELLAFKKKQMEKKKANKASVNLLRPNVVRSLLKAPVEESLVVTNFQPDCNSPKISLMAFDKGQGQTGNSSMTEEKTVFLQKTKSECLVSSSPDSPKKPVLGKSGSQTIDQGKSGSQTIDQGKSGSQTIDQGKSGSQTIDQGKSGSQTIDQGKSGTQTIDQGKSGSQTIDQSLKSCSTKVAKETIKTKLFEPKTSVSKMESSESDSCCSESTFQKQTQREQVNDNLSEQNLSKSENSRTSPESATAGDEESTTIKLIGKNIPQKISREKIVNTLVARETVEPKFKPSESLRIIGTSAGIAFKYLRGVKVPLNEGSSGRSLLDPVHYFCAIKDLNGAKILAEWSREIIKFVCGCLNSRLNGIIRFGIVPENSSMDADYGEIIGVCLKKDISDYEEFLKKAIKKAFLQSQVEIALQCINGPAFIETLSDAQSEGSKLFVIELDVIPKHQLCLEEVFIVKLPTEKKSQLEPDAIYRMVNCKPEKLLDQDEAEFRRNLSQYVMQRKEMEEQSRRKQRIENDLSRKFTLLFCHGEENLLGDHYHMLVINKLDDNISAECIANTLSFISEIEWKVVFDFDPSAVLCNYVQDQGKLVKINTTDDFHPKSRHNIQDPERLKQLMDDMKTFDCTIWCFANGYDPLNDASYGPFQWKRNKTQGFKETVRFFNNQIPQGRATIVFLMLSKDTDVMLEAADDVMTAFPDQWMCVAESEDIGKPWIDELLRRNCVEPEASESKVVWGMPWKHVQETVNRILGPKKCSACMLPTSTGALIPLPNKANNEWIDLQILSSTECENAEITHSYELLEQHKKTVEEEFYKGDSVSWWNFWFHQVCSRDILEPAKKQVRSALNSEDDAVGKVFVYHQPGAGGTTAAKNILWEFRKEYRCAVIQKISVSQTAQQVLKFFRYEDRDPKPVILLLDNPEADKLNLLYADLCEMSRYMVKYSHEAQKVVCVLLVCSRLYHKNVDFDPKKLLLKHELSQSEINWFQGRYKILTREYMKTDNSDLRPPNAVHPRLLFSFNVMKENFNKNYIRRTVKELVNSVTKEKELKLLKYVSLLNSYDLDCRPIPTASLDGLMLDMPWLYQGGLRYGSKAKSNRWETKLSAEVRTLLNETSETAMGRIHSLRIVNPLLSREILFILRNNGTLPVSDIAKEFFNSKEIFNSLCLPRDNLVNIVKDVLKKRQQKGGKPDKAFSPLIQHIVDSESIDSAVEVMKQVLTLTADPYIDQQLARLFIKAQNWDRAVEYAKKATEQKPENSFFWDTYGRIHEKQLNEEYDKLTKDTLPHSITDLVHVIRIALDGMYVFRKVQETSEREKTTIQANKAGFFGELQLVACLLDCLAYVFRDVNELRDFILKPEYVPDNCKMLVDVDGCNYLGALKSLEKHVQLAMNRLEDELVQLRDDTLYEYKKIKYSAYETDCLTRLKEHLDLYFGEDNDMPPEGLDEKQQCEYRRRRVFRLASRNIGSIFDLRCQPEGNKSLQRIQKIAKKNLETCHANAQDYLMIICVNLALTSMDVSSLYDCGIKFDEMVRWSCELYRLRETIGIIHLEPYLFYVMFNWPRKNTRHSIAPKLIETALRQWKDAYYAKYPRQQEEGKPYRKKDTTFFFLANGSDMASIYTTFEERGSRRINENRGRDSFWRIPDTLRKLQRFDGVLSRDGNDVSVYLHYEQGNKAPITIPTSFPIQIREMWNKKVYFVIGFSWNGPRAFDVTLTDPTMEHDMATDHRITKHTALANLTFSRRQPHDYTQEDFNRQCSKLRTQLKKIRKIEEQGIKDYLHKLSQEEMELLRRKRTLEENLDHLLESRRRDMDFRIPDLV